MFLTSQVPLYTSMRVYSDARGVGRAWNPHGTPQRHTLQGYLAYEKLPTHRTLQQDYAWGPMAQ